jgi:chromosome partitioning protein
VTSPETQRASSFGDRGGPDRNLESQQGDGATGPPGQTPQAPATPPASRRSQSPGRPLATTEDPGAVGASAQRDAPAATPSELRSADTGDGGTGDDEGQSRSHLSPTPTGSPRTRTAGSSVDAPVHRPPDHGETESPASASLGMDSSSGTDAGSGRGETGQESRGLVAGSTRIWFEPATFVVGSQGFGQAPEWLASEPDDARPPDMHSRGSSVAEEMQVPREAIPGSDDRVQESGASADRTRGGVQDPGVIGTRSGHATLAPDQPGPAPKKGGLADPTGSEDRLSEEGLGPAPDAGDLAPPSTGPGPNRGDLESPGTRLRSESGMVKPGPRTVVPDPHRTGPAAEVAELASGEAGIASRADGPTSGAPGQDLPREELPATEPARDQPEPGASVVEARDAGGAPVREGATFHGDGMELLPEGVASSSDRIEPASEEVDSGRPSLEPGLQEIVRRLVAPPGQGREQTQVPQGQPPMAGGQRAHGAGEPGGQRAHGAGEPGDGGAPPPNEPGAERDRVPVEEGGDPQSEVARRSTGTSAKRPQKENISPARSASKKRGRGRRSRGSSPGGKHRPNVSRETLSSGEVADDVGEDQVIEDEAAIAVRQAALRAAAEVPGTNDSGQRDASADSQDDVSRETSRGRPDASDGSALDIHVVESSSPSPDEPSPKVDIERAAHDARVTFRIARGEYNRFAIAVANQKGGVGKSTTAVNLGAYLALAGARVLVVDLDPQGNASTGLGLDHRQVAPSVYDVLVGDSDAASAIRQTPVSNLDVLPSTIDLAGAEVELVNAFSRETRLRQALGSVRYGYDFVFIDCPPSLGLLTVNALAAADELLIPIQCEYYALEGLGQLLRNVDLVRANLNYGLHIGGIVLTMYDGRTRLAEQVVQEVRKHFADLVYQTVVPRSVRLSESPGYGVPIALYDPLSRGGIAYRDLALELADRSGLLAPTREGAN